MLRHAPTPDRHNRFSFDQCSVRLPSSSRLCAPALRNNCYLVRVSRERARASKLGYSNPVEARCMTGRPKRVPYEERASSRAS